MVQMLRNRTAQSSCLRLRAWRPLGAVHWPALTAAVLVTLFSLVLVWAFLEWVMPWLMVVLEAPSLHLRLALTALWTAACLALLWHWWRRRGRTDT